MRRALWPDAEDAELPTLVADPVYAVLVAEDREARPVGFAELSIRSYAEGHGGPAAYLEGIWVDPGHRRRGVALALLAAAEAWARARGHSHLGSDALLDNEASHAWHRAAGFAEIERIVVFGKEVG